MLLVIEALPLFRYRRQFEKLLHCFITDLLPELEAALRKDQPDILIQLEIYYNQVSVTTPASDPGSRRICCIGNK